MNENSNAIYSESELVALSCESPWLNPFRLPDGRLTRPAGGGGSLKDRVKTRLAQLFDVRGKTVLDIGCSEGMYSFYLAEKGATVVGLDLDERRLRKADFIRRVLGFQNVRFEEGNILDARCREKLPKVDLILAWGFLHRIPDPFTALALMGSLCNSISLEWRTPVWLFPPGFCGATHGRPGGPAASGNPAQQVPTYTEKAGQPPISSAAEYWRLNLGLVRAMLCSSGFNHFSACTVKNETTWAHVALNWAQFLVHQVAFRDAPLHWGPSRRVHLLAEKQRAVQPAGHPEKEAFQPAKWDGRFDA